MVVFQYCAPLTNAPVLVLLYNIKFITLYPRLPRLWYLILAMSKLKSCTSNTFESIHPVIDTQKDSLNLLKALIGIIFLIYNEYQLSR